MAQTGWCSRHLWHSSIRLYKLHGAVTVFTTLKCFIFLLTKPINSFTEGETKLEGDFSNHQPVTFKRTNHLFCRCRFNPCDWQQQGTPSQKACCLLWKASSATSNVVFLSFYNAEITVNPEKEKLACTLMSLAIAIVSNSEKLLCFFRFRAVASFSLWKKLTVQEITLIYADTNLRVTEDVVDWRLVSQTFNSGHGRVSSYPKSQCEICNLTFRQLKQWIWKLSCTYRELRCSTKQTHAGFAKLLVVFRDRGRSNLS